MQYDAQREFLKTGIKAGDMVGVPDHNIPVYAILGSFLLWTDFYLIICMLNQKCSAEWNCRIVTAIHGAFSAFLCLISALVGPWPFTYVGKPNTNLHIAICIISLGYFLFDFTWCMYMKTEGPIMLAHHVVSIFGFVYVLYQGRYGCELTAVMGASEFTNPILQLRWFMKKTGYYHGIKEQIIDWGFVVLFCGARLVVGTAYHYIVQTSPNADLVTKAGGQVFYIISWIFGIQLLLFVYRKYFKKRPRKED